MAKTVASNGMMKRGRQRTVGILTNAKEKKEKKEEEEVDILACNCQLLVVEVVSSLTIASFELRAKKAPACDIGNSKRIRRLNGYCFFYTIVLSRVSQKKYLYDYYYYY